ncbi:phenoloxidase-activating factor 2-like [Chrysoperla carnea]|uniref:phenoloxidase-activating factor 2-like n=1 Tax=Chrysoperla carnea TaxID=189513 RepID=UPI001D06E7C9|nr:phenoloxidase-activating factor 2-like [Chrysoperla carnea]
MECFGKFPYEATPQVPRFNPYQCPCYPVACCAYCGRYAGFNPRVVTPYNCNSGYYPPQKNSLPEICGNRRSMQPRTNNLVGRAVYGEYPWTGAILDTANSYLGGCVLINKRTALTAAHKIADYTNTPLKVRFGFLNGKLIDDNTKEYNVQTITIHPNYDRTTFKSDIAILKFSEDITYSSVIGPVCLPNTENLIVGSQKCCWVSGWGQDKFTDGMYQSVQKSVQVPIVDTNSCERQLQSTQLGQGFTLDRNSFICAGGNLNEDACTGDGGSPLVCELTTGQWTVVGLVSWGVGCGQPKIPGVYVNVAHFLPWIQSQNNIR